ncbi:MAG: DNA translocase FtsK [Candidatus Omnitrophica bacterium]|nr:DNA translocase FtsK [Candidatus Omnitrophota bacterium]
MTNQTQEAVTEAWQNLEQERRREIISIPLIAFSLICFLALFSYHPSDLASHATLDAESASVQNWIGKPGAWLAYGIIFLFGASGYCVPALLILWGVDRLRRGADQPTRKIRIIGCVALLITASSFLGIMTEIMNPNVGDEQIWQVCGAIGYVLGRRLLELGHAGALIVNGSFLAVSALLCTPFLFTNFFRRIAIFIFTSRRWKREKLEEWEEECEDGEDDSFLAPSAPEFDRNGIRLKPLREANGECSSPPPMITTHDREKLDSLRPLEEEDGLPPLKVEESKGLKIITREEEPIKEADLGVNLIETPTNDEYQLPSVLLLEKPNQTRPEIAREEIIHNSQLLEQTLKDFNITAKVVEVNYGPTITCYELEPAPGIKISRIENLANDITRSLKAESVRIVAPIPGKGTVGVEVPNRYRSDVFLREMIACEKYQALTSKLRIGLGKEISGEPFVFDLIKAPHLLVAGATGSGKSVCINVIITSILYNAAPHEVKLLLIDPKQVELAIYRDIPHLLSPVVTDPMKAGAALQWAVEEMEQRYRYLKKAGVRNVKEFNKKRMDQQKGNIPESESSLVLPGFLPYIVILIDELADLMMIARVDVEASIARLAAMARAVGIHLVLATQRPSVDVLTGVIKNNFPSRIAFQVSSSADSRTILDMKGAESLMGRGDMLFAPSGAGRPIRLQCSFISTEECEGVVDFVKEQQDVDYVQEEFIPLDDSNKTGMTSDASDIDDLYDEAVQCVLENDAASTSLLQRRLKIGYGRAARLLDLMEENGIVGPPRGSKPREIVLNKMN